MNNIKNYEFTETEKKFTISIAGAITYKWWHWSDEETTWK
jgi:hypothetical protein